ncbi:MAG TPA: sugar-transfer associated ATP-grasp domain-containing protein, partial [Thermodesulfobacteriota bacterium]|nr:sugar-transfer associated ATP-grasp domain-containing protein [Thermodesulfobacteriota bacterium]
MWFNRLRSLGILGINQRNANYTLLANPRKFYPLVDDKLLTKQIAIQNGIKVPQLYQVINYHHQIPEIMKLADVHPQFVVKPSMGCAGEGILIIVGRREE